MNMRGKYVEVIIGLDGDCTVEGHNFVGAECEHYLAEINSAIGEPTGAQEKPEKRQRVSPRHREHAR